MDKNDLWVLELIRDRDCKSQVEIDVMNKAIALMSRSKGKWIDSGSGWKCSHCGFQNDWTLHLKHCPECCADMRSI